ncbi:hypothetical protein JL09_g7045, partial [Pichia kudriavzevii]
QHQQEQHLLQRPNLMWPF